jgi:hypothetical protein
MYTEQEYKSDINRLFQEYNFFAEEYHNKFSKLINYDPFFDPIPSIMESQTVNDAGFVLEQKFLSYQERLFACQDRYDAEHSIDNCPRCNSKRKAHEFGFCLGCGYNPNK